MGLGLCLKLLYFWVKNLISNLNTCSKTVAANSLSLALNFAQCTQTTLPRFVLLRLEMAVACHRKVLSKVVIIGSAQDMPIG